MRDFIISHGKRLSDDLRKVEASKKLVGIEKPFGKILIRLKYCTPSELLLNVGGANPHSRARTTDRYVVGSTISLLPILFLSQYAPLSALIFALFLLVFMIINLMNVVFLTKVFGDPLSFERTLLLFVFNVIQVIFTFAIWYRFALSKTAGEALLKALLVFGTVESSGADWIVGLQTATDVLLLAIFLPFVVGNLGRRRG